MRVLGLDVSSAIIGVSVLDGTPKTIQRIYRGHIDLTKDEGIWEKIDHVRRALGEFKEMPEFQGLERIAVEEALLGFRAGASSATTITMLLRMNIIASFLAREQFGMTPRFIPAPTARKTCGIKTMTVAKAGKPVKQQVFEHMCKYDLSDVDWPRKKLSKQKIEKGEPADPKDFCYDECDAYVIAKACMLMK